MAEFRGFDSFSASMPGEYSDHAAISAIVIGNDNPILMKGLEESIKLAVTLRATAAKLAENDLRSLTRHAAQAAMLTVSAMLTATLARCNIANPAVDIEMRPDASGNLIFRCQHATPHSWSLDGQRLS